MTSDFARAREGRGAKVRSEAYKLRHKERDRERRKAERLAKGGKTRAEYLEFVRDQAVKTREARIAQCVVIQPSIAKRQVMQSSNVAGETVSEFLARGGRIDVLPGFSGIRPGLNPARHVLGTGARAP